MIYKHPYGKYIDLSKVIMVSGPKIFGYYQVGYEITCQLLDQPIKFVRETTEEETHGPDYFPLFWALKEPLTDEEAQSVSNMFSDWETYFPKSVCYDNIKKEIESFIKIWEHNRFSLSPGETAT